MIAHVHTLFTLCAIDSNTHIFDDINILDVLMSIKTRRLFSRYFFDFKELAEMKFLRKRKKEKVNEIKEKDSGDLSQVMIIISGLAVAGIVVTGAIAGVSLTKGEESARCISEFSTFESGANKSDCSITASDNGGTLPPGGNEDVTPGTPIEKDESLPTPDECFKIKVHSSGISITKYLITTKPELCGKDVVIPAEINGAPVVYIDSNSFNPLSYDDFSINEEHKINSVIIPSTVKMINRGAFANNMLTSVIIPDSVTRINDDAFKMNKLSSVKLSSSLESLSSRVFLYNELTSIDIPDSVKHIDYEAFRGNNITHVNIPKSVKRIDEMSFVDNKLTSVNISDSVEYIGSGAFRNNLLTSVVIPDSVTTMGAGAFQDNKLNSVVISNSLTSIETTAFNGNQLTSVTVPKSVKSIGDSAFYRNPNLEELRLPAGIKTPSGSIPAGVKVIYY